jgi:squalene synthase HpnC
VTSPLETEAIMAKSDRENFPVASRFLPARTRTHLLAIYGFARLVDDIGDEADGDRLARLDRLERDLDRVYARTVPDHPILQRLAATVRRFDVPDAPFRKLIEANRQDQRVTSYATYGDLLAYCDLSANPVGHLVLYVFEASSPRTVQLSDAICTGLQLTEHWQDVKEDLRRGRVYLPQEDLAAFGCTRGDLGASRPTDGMRRLMAVEVERARSLLDEGAPLAAELPGRPGVAVAAFVAGGRSALGAIARAGFDVLGRTPRPSKAARAWELARTLVEVRTSPGRRGSARRRSDRQGSSRRNGVGAA